VGRRSIAVARRVARGAGGAQKALPLAGQYGVEREPLEARLAQIETELAGDVSADRVPASRAQRADGSDHRGGRAADSQAAAEFPILSIKSAAE
jgi:hypothetical protein